MKNAIYFMLKDLFVLNPFKTEAVIIQKSEWFLYGNGLRLERVMYLNFCPDFAADWKSNDHNKQIVQCQEVKEIQH